MLTYSTGTMHRPDTIDKIKRLFATNLFYMCSAPALNQETKQKVLLVLSASLFYYTSAVHQPDK